MKFSGDFFKKTESEIKEEERKKWEAFEKLSPDEKIRKLKKAVDTLGSRLDHVIVEQILADDESESRYNKLLAYLRGIEETHGSYDTQIDTWVVSTQKIQCTEKDGESHIAILLIHGDGKVTVKCNVKWCDCKWGSLES